MGLSGERVILVDAMVEDGGGGGRGGRGRAAYCSGIDDLRDVEG